ncbi:hypothetical protein B0T36_03185 [Nocardia donostiensis]|uniref:hypothetical protein n=1 Tax=Nocardia donostiensis TaxID=1538463 RepID=UPI0009D9A515|nr:hypothetical protein [Nocardia donostiensis]OQS16689.1 hypothetical protein B0T36_03185 [Nocardia donostiensis]
MPEDDPGDVFLRHRGAVLDALLSDPGFGSSGGNVEAEQPSSVGVSAPTGTVDAVGTGDTDVSFDLPAPDPVSMPAPEVQERPRRTSTGPSASERINALLSGQAPDRGPAADFSSDYSELAASRLNTSGERAARSAEQPEPEPATPATSGKRASIEQMARGAVTELKKPKVALTVGVIVAVLILVLLITTGGKDNADSQPLAVSQLPPTPAPQDPSPEETSSRIEVASAESHCPPGSTDGMDAFSGEPGKAWQCVRAYRVDGQVLRITLDKEYEIDSIGIVPGWDHVDSEGTDQWTKFRTVSRVSYQFDNKKIYTQDTLDQRTLVVTEIDPPITTSEIVLTILKSAGDPSTNAVAISSIVITGQE